MESESVAPPEVLVEVRNLSKHYGPIKAVDGMSFEVRRGDVLGFLGPNGAGKTTAMKMITGFLEPDAGSVRVGEFDVASRSLEARRKIGYLPENAPAYGEMTVEGFLRFVAEARELQDVTGAVQRVVGETGLKQVVHQTIDTLSKGFKRRVGLAQALIHDPEVLILDEPTDGLDPNQKAVVHELIVRLAQDKALILSTHILDEVERVCTRAMIVSKGRILVDSTPAELLVRAPRHNVLRLVLEPGADAAADAATGAAADAELAARLEAEPWCRRVERQGGGAFEIVPEDAANHVAEVIHLVGPRRILELQVQEGRLDDLFRSITQGVAA